MTTPAPIINNNVSQTDLMYFKEEILGNIKQMENKVNDKINQMTKLVDTKLSPYQSKFDEMSSKLFELSNLISVDKSTNEKVSKLMEFKVTVDELLQLLELKINQCNKDISNATYKYDKVLIENLMIPGLLGMGCKYPTLKSFIESCINQLSSLNSYKDRNTIDLKGYKEKLEGLVKQFSKQIEEIKSIFIDYCKKSVDECETKFLERIKTTDDRIELMRVENGRYAIDLKKQCNDLGIEWERILKIKEEVYSRFDEEIENFKKMHEGTESSMNEYKKEFKLIKKKFTELSEFIKDVRFRKNLGGDVKRRELKEMSDKINFEKKQKYDLSDDDEDDTKSNGNTLIVLKHTGGYESPTIEPRKPDIFNEEINIKAPFSPQIRRKGKKKMIDCKPFINESIPLIPKKSIDKPIENLDKIESTLKAYIHSESKSSNKSNTIKVLSKHTSEKLNKEEENSNRINSTEKGELAILLKKIPPPKEVIQNNTEEVNTIDFDKDKDHYSLVTKEKEYVITKKTIEYNQEPKKEINSINEFNDSISPQVEKQSLTIESQKENREERMKKDVKTEVESKEEQSIKSIKKVVLSPLQDIKSNTIHTHTKTCSAINKRLSITSNNFKKIIPNTNNSNTVNSDIMNKISKTEMKISSLERSTNSKFKEIVEQITHLSNQITNQKEGSRTSRNLKLNIISDPFSQDNQLLLSKGSIIMNNENNTLYHQRNISINTKSRTIRKLRLNSESNQTGSNHFSPLSLLINNEPKYKPTDECNKLLNNIEPYLIKQFEQ